MDKKTIVENNPGVLLAVLVIPAIVAGIFVGYLRGWLIGLIVTAIFSADSIWTFRSVWLRKEIDSTTKKELESRWITLFNQAIESVLAAITIGAIYLLLQSPEVLDLLESRNALSTILPALVYTALFVVIYLHAMDYD